MKESDNILRILLEAREAVELQNYSKLKELSNQTVNTASRTHDVDNINVAVVVYSIGKIYEMPPKEGEDLVNFKKSILLHLQGAIENIKDEGKFRMNLSKIRNEIKKLSGDTKKYVGV